MTVPSAGAIRPETPKDSRRKGRIFRAAPCRNSISLHRMPDPFLASTPISSPPGPKSWRRAAANTFRFLAVTCTVQAVSLVLVRLALFLRIDAFKQLPVFLGLSLLVSLVLAAFLFRRITNPRWALGIFLAASGTCAYLLVRVGFGWFAHTYEQTLLDPLLRNIHFADRTKGSPPPAMESHLPFDTVVIDGPGMPESDPSSLRKVRRILSEELSVRCDATLEEAIRVSARISDFDLGSKEGAYLVICGGTIASLTIAKNVRLVHLDTNRVVLESLSQLKKTVVFTQFRGDTEISFIPDTMVFRIRHKRDSLRRWQEDSAKSVAQGH